MGTSERAGPALSEFSAEPPGRQPGEGGRSGTATRSPQRAHAWEPTIIVASGVIEELTKRTRRGTGRSRPIGGLRARVRRRDGAEARVRPSRWRSRPPARQDPGWRGAWATSAVSASCAAAMSSSRCSIHTAWTETASRGGLGRFHEGACERTKARAGGSVSARCAGEFSLRLLDGRHSASTRCPSSRFPLPGARDGVVRGRGTVGWIVPVARRSFETARKRGVKREPRAPARRPAAAFVTQRPEVDRLRGRQRVERWHRPETTCGVDMVRRTLLGVASHALLERGGGVDESADRGRERRRDRHLAR